MNKLGNVHILCMLPFTIRVNKIINDQNKRLFIDVRLRAKGIPIPEGSLCDGKRQKSKSRRSKVESRKSKVESRKVKLLII